jgi:hypothetical protein
MYFIKCICRSIYRIYEKALYELKWNSTAVTCGRKTTNRAGFHSQHRTLNGGTYRVNIRAFHQILRTNYLPHANSNYATYRKKLNGYSARQIDNGSVTPEQIEWWTRKCYVNIEGMSGFELEQLRSITSRGMDLIITSRRPGFDRSPHHDRFVLDNVAMGQGSSQHVSFHPSVSFHQRSILITPRPKLFM